MSQRLIDQRDLGTEWISVYAKFDAIEFRMLVKAISSRPNEDEGKRTSIRGQLAAGISSTPQGCELQFLDDPTNEGAALVALYIAERTLYGLLRPFSRVAGIS